MLTSKLAIRRAAEIALFSFLLLLAGMSYGQVSQELAQGEELVTLNVENMT